MRPVLCLLLLGLSACGARSALPEPGSGTGGTGGAAADPCAPASVTATCASAIASAPAGTEVWSTTLPTGGYDLLGPVAADGFGTSYFVSAESALYVKKVFALDACGALRFEADVGDLLTPTGYVPQVIVAGGHLYVITVGAVFALDPDSGKLVWSSDLEAFAESGGLGVAPGKVQALGYTAAKSDGTLFSVIANDQDAWIVRLSAKAKPTSVAKVPSYVGGFGYPLGAQQFVLDAAGDVVLTGGSHPGASERIDAFTPSGTSVFSTTLPSWGNGRFLAAGPDYVTGEYLWLIDHDGTLRNTFPGTGATFVVWGSPSLIDETGELFSVGGQQLSGVSTMTFNLLGRFGADGSQRWTTTLAEPLIGGPVLDDGDHVLAITGATTDPGTPLHLVAVNRGDGTTAWQRTLSPSGKIPSYWLLQNAAGALVVAIDGRVHAYSSGGTRPPTCAYWPTPRGDLGQRAAPHGT